jgi:uncharacterized protein (DUF58 family)
VVKSKKVDVARIPRLSRSGGLELRARAIIQGLRTGRHRSPARGASLEFAEHRPYQPGDELRSIDWKAYARSDHLLIRRFVDERSLPLGIVIDGSASMRWGKPDKFAHAQLIAAVLGVLALDQGDEVDVWSVGTALMPGGKTLGGTGATTALVERLASITWTKGANWGKALTSLANMPRRKSLFVLIGDFLDEPASMLPALATLRARGHDLAFLQVLSPEELHLPDDWGRMRLTDPEQAIADVDFDADQIAAAYAEAMAQHLATVRRCCAAARCDHLLVPTQRPLAAVLGSWLAGRSRSRAGR